MGMESLLFEEQAQFAGELMLEGDPGFVGGGFEIENRLTANRGRGKARDESQQRLPFESGKVGVKTGDGMGSRRGMDFSVLRLS